jgi:hypothetical protein
MATLVAMRCGRIVVGTAAVLAALWAPASAVAQSPEATDPTAGSPSGTIYHLPVDTGRSDAAPRPPGSGGGANPDDEGKPGALYRSDNNFGTSSQVPGAGANGGAAAGGKGGSGGSGAAAAKGESEKGEQPAVALAGAADTGQVSEPLAFGLLAVIVAAGAGLGLGLRRARADS